MATAPRTHAARRTILGAGVALALAAVLAGCSATTSVSLIPTAPKSAATAPATGTQAAPAAAATAVTGAVVNAEEAHSILVAGKGQRAYPMADGTFVVVTKTEPLPAAVQADADAKVAAAVAAYPDDTVDHAAAEDAFRNTEGAIAIGTGKRVIFVVGQMGYSTGLAETKTFSYVIRGIPSVLGTVYEERADAQAAVEAFLAGVDNTVEWIVVWGE